ncbi:MAG: sulfite exporter TauE/SafE family protein [Bacteroidia bacterium]|nr:sulfite exporter TauE/SafE family protein [Bacteroidia bacterium]
MNPGDFAVLCAVALLVGMAKTGIHGAGMAAVPLLAAVFGGQRSAGMLLPVLVMADVFGVVYYHRHASWHHLKKLLPFASAGVVLGTVVGQYINDEVFRLLMAIIIAASVVIMLWMERGHKEDVPAYPWFAALMGLAGGFTSMVGNLAGSVMALYFLSMRLPKNNYIGTTAWFFLVINWFKVPFHVFAWHTINGHTLLAGVLTLPFIGIGAWLGVTIVKLISESVYRLFIIGITLLAAVYMML